MCYCFYTVRIFPAFYNLGEVMLIGEGRDRRRLCYSSPDGLLLHARVPSEGVQGCRRDGLAQLLYVSRCFMSIFHVERPTQLSHQNTPSRYSCARHLPQSSTCWT